MLDLHHIKKYYSKHLVLDIPLLQLDRNIYWAKGPNGSGKSTLLRMIAGLLPFEGNILLEDINLKHQGIEYRRRVSWADAEPLYPPFLTGIELVKFYAGARKVSMKGSDKMIEMLGMQDYIANKLGTYSSGMTKKLSLVLAFIGSMDLIILDEPFITLDTEAVEALSEFIINTHADSGTMFLLSSHMDLDKNLLASAHELTVRNKSVFE